MNESKDSDPVVLSTGGWLISTDNGVIRNGDRESRLTLLQMKLLLFLIKNHERVVGKEEILQSVWSGAQVEEVVLARCISEIRSLLGDDARRPQFIQTLPKRGYQWIARIERLSEDPTDGAPQPDDRQGETQSTAETPTAAETPTDSPATLSPSRLKRPALTAGLVLVTSLGLALLAGHLRSEPPQSSELSKSTPSLSDQIQRADTPSVAVLDLLDLGAQPEGEWLASALAEMLTSELALSQGLGVVPRAAITHLQSELGLQVGPELSLKTLEQLRNALGVKTLVSGTYLRGPDRRLRVDLRIWGLDTHRGFHAIVEEGSMDELSNLVSNAGSRVRALLGAPETHRAGPATSMQSAELYAKAQSALRRQEAGAAKELLEAALTFDSSDPLIWLALSEAWSQIGFEGRAREAAESAVSFSADLPREQQLWVEAEAFRSRKAWDAAIERLRALNLFSPDNREYTLRMVRLLNEAGRGREALEAVPAELLDADDPRWLIAISEAQHQLNDYAAAEKTAARAVTAASQLGTPRILAASQHRRALSLHELGEIDRAKAALETAETIFGEVGDRRREAILLGTRATWLQGVGRFEAALEKVDAGLKLLRQIDDRRHEMALLRIRGRIEARTGQEAAARKSIEQALALSRELDIPVELARAHHAMAIQKATSGEFNAARTDFEEALSLYRQLEDPEQIAAQLQDLGRVSMLQGDFISAEAQLSEAAEILSELPSERRLATTELNLGVATAVTGKLQAAEKHLRSAARVFRRVENDLLLALALSILGEVLVDRGDLKTAAEVADESERLYRKLGEPQRLANARTTQALILLERGEPRVSATLISDILEGEDPLFGTTRVIAYRLAAEAALALGELDDAAQALEKAEDVLAGGSVSPTALCRLWLPITQARHLAARNRAEEAQELAASSMELAAAQGAWIAHAEAETLHLEIQLHGDHQGTAGERLEQLRTDAENKGWNRIAERIRMAGLENQRP